MKELKTDELQSGTILAGELYLTNKEEFLLSGHGTLVSEELIAALNTWRYKTIYTSGNGNFIASNTGVQVEFDSSEEEGVTFAQNVYKKAYKECADLYASYRENNEINIARVTELIKMLIVSIREQRRFVLRLSLYTSLREDYFLAHAVETTILSLAMGEHLKLASYKLIDLGTSALLHEIGLLRMPSLLLDANRPLTEEERKVLSAHVVVGYKLLKEIKGNNNQPANLSVDVLQAVLQHHERLDGSGYVQRLEGGAISEYAQIIGIACSYHAQIADRPFRSGKDQHLSLVGMVKSMGKQYDERLLKFLLQTISLYPIGSAVKLSDGSVGQIVDADPEDPLHPTVHIIYDGNGTALPIERNIILNDELRVVGILKDRDLHHAPT